MSAFTNAVWPFQTERGVYAAQANSIAMPALFDRLLTGTPAHQQQRVQRTHRQPTTAHVSSITLIADTVDWRRRCLPEFGNSEQAEITHAMHMLCTCSASSCQLVPEDLNPQVSTCTLIVSFA